MTAPRSHLPVLWLLASLAAGCHRETPPGPPPSAPPASTNATGSRLLEDITQHSRLTFTHDSGAAGKYFMPEQAGSGGAVLDYDNDGRLDVYLIQCGGPGSSSPNQLFHQEPDGTFRNATAASGLDITGYGMGATAGDVNNDGRTDLFVTEYGAVHLLLNLGSGHFTNVTAQAGIENRRWATAASFVDYDRDGWLDLVVANYLDYNPTHQCFDAAGNPEYCGPHNFQGTITRLFHNLGAAPSNTNNVPRFADVTVPAGLTRAAGPALGVFCADFDGDRWPDIFVADDGRPNRLFMNQKNGTFREEATLRGIAYNAMGATAGNMGIAVGDVNADGLFDLFVTHLAEEQHALWVQGPRGLFQDQTAGHGLANPAWRGTGFGNVLADLDLDGSLDLAFVNGRVRRGPETAARIAGLSPHWHPYAQRYQLFLNDGAGRFLDISAANPPFCGQAAVGRGLAVADFDNDGDLDLLTTCTGGPAQLFRNTATRRGHWLVIRALDPAQGGREACGAEITVHAANRRWWRLVQPSYSYLVSNDPRAHFGLGPAATVDSIHVLWPDGTDESFPGTTADQFITLEKGRGKKGSGQ